MAVKQDAKGHWYFWRKRIVLKKKLGPNNNSVSLVNQQVLVLKYLKNVENISKYLLVIQSEPIWNKSKNKM